MVVHEGTAVPTDARMFFTVETSAPAYVYMFQTTPSREVTVLFPNPKISASNPLPAKQPSRIPQGGKAFRVNEKDVGTEMVFVVADRKPVAGMESALQKVLAGQVVRVDDDPWLKAITTVVSGSDDSCSRGLELVQDTSAEVCARGLVLEDDAGGDAGPSLVVRNDPADDRILRVLQFDHVSKDDYARLRP